jgi:Protein of unknown function (DUF3574)
MRTLGAPGLAITAAGLLLSGCVSVTGAPPAPACPTGQTYLQTAQLFFGRNIGGAPGVSETDFRKFVDEELTPRFPDGLTVLDGGGQWRGKDEVLIREASKVVLIVLPKGRDSGARIEAVRDAYKIRFRQESVLVVTQGSCVSF